MLGPAIKPAAPTNAAQTMENLFIFPPQIFIVDINRHFCAPVPVKSGLIGLL
jgi:hypothetical protein